MKVKRNIEKLIEARNAGVPWAVVIADLNEDQDPPWTVATAIAAYSYHCPEEHKRPRWLRAGKLAGDGKKNCLVDGCTKKIGSGLRYLCREHFERGY